MSSECTSKHSRSRQFLFRLALIVLGALALRLLVCSQLSGLRSVIEPWKGTDMATYRRYALDILIGKWPEHFYYQPFYYSVFLPIVYAVFGKGPWGVMLVQSLLGAATVWLVGLTTARVFGRRAGLIAAGLLALSRFHIFYSPFLLIAVLQAFWMALLVYTALRAYSTNRWRHWFGAAVVLSLATLTRGTVLLLIPGVLALFVWRARRDWKRAALGTVLLIAMVYLPQLPFALRNVRHYGRWTGPSSAQDAVLALGNTPEAPPGGLLYPPLYHEWMRKANLPPDERTPVTRQMLRWFFREPLAYTELKFRTLLLFWNRLEIPNNVAMVNEGKHSALLNLPVLLGFAFTGTLGVCGMLLLWRWRDPKRDFLYFIAITYALATVLFYILARFRIPLVPLVCCFGGGAVDHGVRLWNQHRRGRDISTYRLPVLLAVSVACFLVLQGFQFYQVCLEKRMLRFVRPDGVRALTQKGLTVYDHGPMACGQWGYMQLPPGGAAISKTFRLSSERCAAGVLTEAVLRIPIVSEARSQLQVAIAVGGKQGPATTVTLQGQSKIEWVEMRLQHIPASNGTVALTVSLIPSADKIFVVVDNGRDYGRTHIYDASGQLVPLGSEAAFELMLPTVPSANGPQPAPEEK